MSSEFVLTDEQRHLACQGKICPSCYSENTIRTGACPDFRNMNVAYKCEDCGQDWEGY